MFGHLSRRRQFPHHGIPPGHRPRHNFGEDGGQERTRETGDLRGTVGGAKRVRTAKVIWNLLDCQLPVLLRSEGQRLQAVQVKQGSLIKTV